MAKATKSTIVITAVDKVSQPLKGVSESFENVGRATKKLNQRAFFSKSNTRKFTDATRKLQDAGRALSVGFVAPTALLGGFAVRKLIDFDRGLRQVNKAADLGTEGMKQLGAQVVAISETMPLTTDELLHISTVAAQLGIKGAKDIGKFTKTVALLQSASNITGEQGAIDLAQTLNVLEGGVQNVDRFSNALVHLGNNAAAFESEILEMTAETSRAFSIFNKTSAGVLGLSAALAELKQNPEAARTALTKTLAALQNLSRKGGAEMEGFARLAGTTSAEFKKALDTDATKALEMFLTVLSSLDKNEKIDFLENLGLNSLARTKNILTTLASRMDLVRKNIKNASDEWKANSAAAREAAQQNKGFGAQIEMSTNKIKNNLVTIGEVFAPLIETFNEVTAAVSGFVKSNPELVRSVAKITAVLAALVAGGVALLTTVATIAKLAVAAKTMGAGFMAALGAVKLLGAGIATALGAISAPIALTVIAIGGLATAVFANLDAITSRFVQFSNYLKTFETVRKVLSWIGVTPTETAEKTKPGASFATAREITAPAALGSNREVTVNIKSDLKNVAIQNPQNVPLQFMRTGIQGAN